MDTPKWEYNIEFFRIGLGNTQALYLYPENQIRIPISHGWDCLHGNNHFDSTLNLIIHETVHWAQFQELDEDGFQRMLTATWFHPEDILERMANHMMTMFK
jgi:hypothetical protein